MGTLGGDIHCMVVPRNPLIPGLGSEQHGCRMTIGNCYSFQITMFRGNDSLITISNWVEVIMGHTLFLRLMKLGA